MKDTYTINPAEQVHTHHYDGMARAFRERVFHALLFEVAALLISAPLFSFLTGKPITAVGLMTLIIGTTAVIWNFIYNAIFDRVTRSFIQERTLIIRVIHAILFELGLIVFTIPVIAYLLSMTLVDAFILDIGIILFFLPYTVVFNWVYDFGRERIWMRKHNIQK